MSHPSFQISGSQPERLPVYHMGSDDLQETLHKTAAEIVHYRLGIPVSVRAWKTMRRWRVNFNLLTATQIELLQAYFEERTFLLLPTDDVNVSVSVRWVGSRFAPTYLFGANYSLAFEIEEVL